MRPAWAIGLAILVLWMARDFARRDIDHPPGALVPGRPVQSEIPPGEDIVLDQYRLERRAAFGMDGRVLSSRRYRFGREADLSPIDLALGWGPMSDQAILDQIEISQGNRWYFTRYEFPAPLPDADIIRHSANMHMIPAEPWVEDELLALRVGDVVRLDGYLVDVRSADGFTWRTSLTREDTGDGSCELFLVTGVRRAPRP